MVGLRAKRPHFTEKWLRFTLHFVAHFYSARNTVIGQVYLCCVPVDFRKQIDGLAALVQGELALDVFGDALFVFVNRQRSRIKILYCHRNGFCLWQKRLEKERFAWPSPEIGRAHV